MKKLGWAPDIVHCNDWMTSLIPLYIKTTYKNDPLFMNTKTVFTIYDNKFTYKFKGDLLDKVKMIDIEDDMLSTLKTLDYEGFIKLGMEYSDAVIKSKEEMGESLQLLLEDMKESKKVDTIEKSENFTDSYLELYNELVG